MVNKDMKAYKHERMKFVPQKQKNQNQNQKKQKTNKNKTLPVKFDCGGSQSKIQ